MGIAVWPMIELEADDALACAAFIASKDTRVHKVCIWTPDKDLGQCVRDDRLVQVDRRSKTIRDAAGVRAKFGVSPALIPDYLALVGDGGHPYRDQMRYIIEKGNHRSSCSQCCLSHHETSINTTCCGRLRP
jgi:hypothetical protein